MTPPPRLVPDRPSVAVRPDMLPGRLNAMADDLERGPWTVADAVNGLRNLARMLAAAPPAEAPAERGANQHVENLRAVLCDPEGRVCIEGSDEDRAIIQRALAALAAAPAATAGDEDERCTWCGAAMSANPLSHKPSCRVRTHPQSEQAKRAASYRPAAPAPDTAGDGWDWFAECRRVLDDVATEMRATGRGDIRFIRLIETMPRAPRVTGGREDAERALDALDSAVANNPARRISWIGFTREDRLSVMRDALQAATGGAE